MPIPAPESPDIVYHVTTALGIASLMALYFFGVWSRSYVLPTADNISVKKQFIASVPVGFITMGLYAKTALPTLTITSTNFVFDGSIMIGYAIIFGMLSRESLERMLKTVTPPSAVPGANKPASP